MEYAPHPYQMQAIKMMCRRTGAALLLDPGMGKTSITLAAFCVLQHYKAIEAVLVIAPDPADAPDVAQRGQEVGPVQAPARVDHPRHAGAAHWPRWASPPTCT